jgi:hypothetical protein
MGRGFQFSAIRLRRQDSAKKKQMARRLSWKSTAFIWPGFESSSDPNRRTQIARGYEGQPK